jgi:hypothetical protein
VPGNQLLESDIVYVRDPLLLARLNVEQLKKYATLAHHCFKSFDLCVFVLKELENRRAIAPKTHLQYLASLAKPKSP